MVLLIDIGNTSVKWGLLKKNQVTSVDRWFYLSNGLPETEIINHWKLLTKPEKVLICNVATNAIGEHVQSIVQQLWHLNPIFIQENQSSAIIEPIKTQNILGVDRWLSLLALHQTEKKPFAVINCGTAITIDICRDGVHQGGLIAPGIGLMRLSLIEHTAACRLKPDHADTVQLLAFDTDGAMRAGSLHMAVAFIETTLKKIKKTLNLPLKTFITGSDTEQLIPRFQKPRDFKSLPLLVLHGLALFADGDVRGN